MPRPAVGCVVETVVSDAAAAGHVSYNGLPWQPPAKGSVRDRQAWLMDPRAVYVVEQHAGVLDGVQPRTQLPAEALTPEAPGVLKFVVFFRHCDNQCAVATYMATQLYSRATTIAPVAARLQKQLELRRINSVAVHLPGVLNVHTDRPSRAGEALYEQAVTSPCLVRWATSTRKAIQIPVG
jgi:hypothetical protein